METYTLVSSTYRYFHPEFLRMQNSSESIRIKNSTMTEKWFTEEQNVLWNLKNDVYLITKEALKTLKTSPADIQPCYPPHGHVSSTLFKTFRFISFCYFYDRNSAILL